MRPKRTILCVDDNEQALSIRKVMLETRGYRVVVSTDGQRAMEIFKGGGIDLVISDFMMPGYNGATLITNMKEVSPETPAILFSGRVKFCDQEHKADLFVPKGTCAPAELLERIRVLLVKKRGPKKASITPANIRHTAS
jgi:CheY-like chemotaxis protein